MNQANIKLRSQYALTIEKELAAGNATEHTHRPALKALVESLATGVTATNEPRRIECGAPDFIITRGSATIGYIEAKDIGKSLDEAEQTEQLERYLNSLTNLILTNYLEFRWYVDGERCLSARLGTLTKEGKIKRDKAGAQAVADLLDSFLAPKAEAVGTPKELALRMARLAHLIRNLIVNAFQKEPESGSLHAQLSAFRDSLIPDLSVEQFADMYAQTIAYGLFAARCTNSTGKDFTRQNAAYLLPKTNPFLRKLFNHIAGPDLDDRIAWLLDDLAQVLAQADMAAILKGFGKRTAKEDPVVHFYETFLTAYDPRVREMRGVYYTPEPVVSYIVRSIDHLLKTRFKHPQGLMDASTLVLDPAVGTATFLYMVVSEIHEAMVRQGQKGMWNDYVTEKLLPRLFGFELLMAPYAVAHLKLGLLLQETGYQFQTDQRLGIYLTNTLEEAFQKSEQLAGFNEYIVDEANAASEIKKDKPIMVVLGNPPYSKSSANKGAYIEGLMERYKTAVRDERNIQPLSDDYIKFIRFAHDRIERTGYGVVGMITNNSYLSGLIHRGMREELVKSFSEIYALNLHGSTRLGGAAPNRVKDENVFDIRQGVAVILLVRCPDRRECAQVRYNELWGIRQAKYDYLSNSDISDTEWQTLNPTSPYFFFVPANMDLKEGYDKGWGVTDIFPICSSGIKTHRDHFVIDFDNAVLKERISRFRDSLLSDEELRESFGLKDTSTWRVTTARQAIRDENDWARALIRCLYRPFDIRPIFYHEALIERSRREVMYHMLAGKNMSLVTDRTTSVDLPFTHVFASDLPIDVRMLPDYGGAPYIFPLYLYPAEKKTQPDKSGGGEGGTQDVMQLQEKREPNLNPEFIKAVSEKLGLRFVSDGRGDLKETFGPENVFDYAYAVFHSPTYRTRYAEFLRIDFPRLPLTSDKELFQALASKGAELVSLHLMESPTLNNLITRYPVPSSNLVERVGYDENTRRVYINKEQYFEGVEPAIWNFHIGGYQVAQKWLKDRKGRMLSYDDLTHYQKVVVAIKETIRLMTEIDNLIPGWPVE